MRKDANGETGKSIRCQVRAISYRKNQRIEQTFPSGQLSDFDRHVRHKCHIPIGGINTISTIARVTLKTTIKSRTGNYSRALTFLIGLIVLIVNISSFIPDIAE